MKRSERGQSSVLAVVGLIVLAIGMYTAYSLSRAVYEKIKLQNAADATAYSLATLEARSFNFIAFANRAQVANYVQMLESQSLLSNASYIEAQTAFAGDVTQAAGKWLKFVPGLGGVGAAVEQTGVILEKAYETTFKPGVERLDEWVPRYVKLETTQNQVLYTVSLALVLATALEVAAGGEAIVQANDTGAELGPVQTALDVVNAASYLAAFDPTSFGTFSYGTSDTDKRAQRLLAEMVNASRYGSFSPRFVVDRPRFAYLQEVLGEQLGKAGDGPTGRKFDKLMNDLMSAGFTGTTKLVTDSGEGALPDRSVTGQDDPEASLLARGGAMIAKDEPLLFNKVGVRVSAESSEHCRYEKPSSYGQLQRMGTAFLFSDIKCDEDPHKHAWKNLLGMNGGITRYLQFASKTSGFSVEQKSFNQPDVWVLLSKDVEKMTSTGDLDFTIEHGNERASFDGRIGGGGLLGSGLAPGMYAIARAQVYYHRPGAWQEPPNFFNPYWSARLAPKNAAVKRVFEEVGLGGLVAQLVGDNLWMH